MKDELRRIAAEAWSIVADPRASRIEKLEGLKLIAASRGVLLPDVDERWLTVRQVCQLRQAKQALLEKVLRKKAVRKRANRRQYIKRQIRAAEAAPQDTGKTNEIS